jgi:hypothetical protein
MVPTISPWRWFCSRCAVEAASFMVRLTCPL